MAVWRYTWYAFQTVFMFNIFLRLLVGQPLKEYKPNFYAISKFIGTTFIYKILLFIWCEKKSIAPLQDLIETLKSSVYSVQSFFQHTVII